MTVQLRPHHLLCLLTYSGHGYSPAFTANFDAIAERLAHGEDVRIVAGPDEICAPLLSDLEPHCRRDSVTERDRLAARAVGDLLDCSIDVGRHLRLDPPTLSRMREAFAAGGIRAACVGCQWNDLCSAIAKGQGSALDPLKAQP